MASTSKALIYLSDEELTNYRPNRRVVLFEASQRSNSLGKPFLVFCNSDKLNPTKGATPIVYKYNFWHKLKLKNGRPYLGETFPEAAEYDDNNNTPFSVQELQEALPPINDPEIRATSPTPPSAPNSRPASPEEQPDPIDLQIRNSPVAPAETLPEASRNPRTVFGRTRSTKPTMSATATTTTTR